MRHAAAGASVQVDLGLAHVDRVGKPHIRPDPIQRLHVGHRAVAKFLEAKGFFILGFRQVGMQVNAILAGQ